MNFACKQSVSERHYQSSDAATGSFNKFSLDLNPNGKLKLIITTSKEVGDDVAGTSWETRDKTVKGKWEVQGEIITCLFDESKQSIDSVFIDTDFSGFSDKALIVFSQKLDTAYIYGIPCVLQ